MLCEWDPAAAAAAAQSASHSAAAAPDAAAAAAKCVAGAEGVRVWGLELGEEHGFQDGVALSALVRGARARALRGGRVCRFLVWARGLWRGCRSRRPVGSMASGGFDGINGTPFAALPSARTAEWRKMRRSCGQNPRTLLSRPGFDTGVLHHCRRAFMGEGGGGGGAALHSPSTPTLALRVESESRLDSAVRLGPQGRHLCARRAAGLASCSRRCCARVSRMARCAANRACRRRPPVCRGTRRLTVRRVDCGGGGGVAGRGGGGG